MKVLIINGSPRKEGNTTIAIDEMKEEGLQTMRVLAENIAFLIKSISLGKKQFKLPQKEEHKATNFIR